MFEFDLPHDHVCLLSVREWAKTHPETARPRRIELNIGYLGALLGIILGVLGALTGGLNRLARVHPEKHLGKLRAVLWVDMAVGWALVVGGVLLWGVNRTASAPAEVLAYAGILMLGCLGAASHEFVDGGVRWRRLVHMLLVGGIVFLAIGGRALLTGTTASRAFIWGGCLVGVYVVSLCVWKRGTSRGRERTW